MNLIRTLLVGLLLTVAGAPAVAAPEEPCRLGWMMRAPMTLLNGGFEDAATGWCAEGPMGVDDRAKYARTGTKSAFMETVTSQWSSLWQPVKLLGDDACVEMTAWIRTTGPVGHGTFGVTAGDTGTVLAHTSFSVSEGSYGKAGFRFRTGTELVTRVFIGHRSPDGLTRLAVDDVTLTRC